VSGFPGPPSYAEVEAARRRLELEQARSDSHYHAPARSPDADDIVDAMRIRAQIIEAGDRRTAAVLLRAATYIRELEHALEAADSQLKQVNKEKRDADVSN
jgi:predicted neutral ceramidase superfamily lipid hydrolase